MTSVPTGSPDNVQNTDVAIDSLGFAWDAILCGSRGGVVSRYSYKFINTASLEEQTGNVARGRLDVSFSGLTPCTTYNFSVAGKTSTGAGPYSEALRVATSVIGKATKLKCLFALS